MLPQTFKIHYVTANITKCYKRNVTLDSYFVTFLQLIRTCRPSVFFASDIESPQPNQRSVQKLFPKNCPILSQMSNHEILQVCYRLSQFWPLMQIPLRLRRINFSTRSDPELTRRSEGRFRASQHLLTLEPVSNYAPAPDSIYTSTTLTESHSAFWIDWPLGRVCWEISSDVDLWKKGLDIVLRIAPRWSHRCGAAWGDSPPPDRFDW